MELNVLFRRIGNIVPRGVGEVKCFERELAAAGGFAFRVDIGIRAIPTERIVGSVGRWNSLRRDFLPKSAWAPTERYHRVGEAMRRGKVLPAIEVYELRTPRLDHQDAEPSGDYYVVDGHHRVAVARQLGCAFLDAHVVLYRTSRAVTV